MTGSAATLFCLPFAGGNAYSYRAFERRMDPAVSVVPLEPPGRGRRLREPPLASLIEVADDLVASLRSRIDTPFALFGHSMGGLLAYLVGCRLHEEGLPLPRRLFISGKGPPGLQSREAQWHTLPLEEFKARLAALGGCAPAVLQDAELMDYFAPVIRDDMRQVAQYRHRPGPPLPVPLTVMLGRAETTTAAEASLWREVTSSTFDLVQYEGGHFFLFDHVADICARIGEALLGRRDAGPPDDARREMA